MICATTLGALIFIAPISLALVFCIPASKISQTQLAPLAGLALAFSERLDDWHELLELRFGCIGGVLRLDENAGRMTSARRSRRALVMAFDESFAPGGATCLFSFRRHNAWYDGRVVVFGDGLGARTRAWLDRLGPIEVIDIDPALRSAAHRFTRSLGAPKAVALRLLSFQLFTLADVDRAVFLDADTICTGDLRPLFDTAADFAAAPDLVQLERDASFQRAVPPQASGGAPYGRDLAYSFNSGVMSVSDRWLTPAVYRDLLTLPGLESRAGALELADQYFLNRYLDGRVTSLDPRYNFIVCAEPLLRQVARLTVGDTRIVHYVGPGKPWEMTWEEARRRVPARFLRYHELWHELFELLTESARHDSALRDYRRGLEELSLLGRAPDG
jgi:lipopolysaccharide biosynthesis glycosyltransferase